MSVYAHSVFLHIVGALGLFTALGLEWASLYNLRRVRSAGQAREWARLLGALRFVGGPSLFAILVTGIYMMATRWGGQGWIGAGLAGLGVIGALGGGLSGRRLGAIARAVPAEDRPLPAALRSRMHDRVLVLSLWLRTTLALAVVFVMSVKPGAAGALTVLGVAVALGLAAAFPAWTGGRGVVTDSLRGD